MSTNKQIFQTTNTGRWERFKWTFRIILAILLFFLVTAFVAIIIEHNPKLPNIEEKAKIYENAVNPSSPLTIRSKKNTAIDGFKKFLTQKDSLDKIHHQPINHHLIRAAFYTPWSRNSTSYQSLVQNANQLNMIFPEWLFLKNDGTIDNRLDTPGLQIMQQYKHMILPMVTNFNSATQKFDGALIHTLLHDEKRQQQFIRDLGSMLIQQHFNGINIDFEEINENSDVYFTRFIQNLYQEFHQKNLLVTIDVAVDDSDYNLQALEPFTDFFMLMAYDEHNDATGPGPVASQKWIENALDNVAATVDSKKIILGMAAFGRDWIKQKDEPMKIADVSYADAVNTAKLTHAKIQFNNNDYNLSFAYKEITPADTLQSATHTVWFTDAATIFNIMRFSDEYGTAGTALWRLGSEDNRIWKFYNRLLTNESLQKHPFDFSLLNQIPYDITQKPTGIGEGELLNVLYSPQPGIANIEWDRTEQLITEQQYIQLPSGYVYERFAEDTTRGNGHKIVLTFDDGPNAEYTPQILSILEKEKVPATFFVVGLNVQQNIPLLQRIYQDGYEIGNHTFTHSNIATMSAERAAIEMKTTRLLIESITGHSTILFRAPYNADSQPQTFDEIEPIARSKKENYITVGESIDPNDWDEEHVNADSIINRIIRQYERDNASIILLHDAGGKSRQATVDALPVIIAYFKNKGCRFTTVADLMGKSKNDVMPPVQTSELGIDKLNFFFAELIYWGGKIFMALFIIGIILSIGRMLLMAVLATLQKRREKNNALLLPLVSFPETPLVSIIVPAYNEEVNAVRTIQSLMAQDYPNLQIIFIDDGSKDATYKTVSNAFEKESMVKVYSKQNGGKASALNYGIEHADGEYLVCIDADTQLKKDAVSELMKKFTDITVGAVAGNVKVGNECNMLTRWQSIEYITSQNFDRRAFDLLNCITVVPGAIGAFRKEAIRWAGGFTTDTLAEDCDLTIRILKKGYTVRNCTTAISYTEVPESLKQFLKQRFRWSYGIMQSFWKHKDALFNQQFRNLGLLAMPNILIYQILLTVLAPLTDFILLISLVASGLGIVTASIPHIILYYFIFTLVDIGGAALAFAFEKEDYKKLVWLIPQRFVYRQLMYYIFFKSLARALKGEAQGWGVLKRTGKVNTANAFN